MNLNGHFAISRSSEATLFCVGDISTRACRSPVSAPTKREFGDLVLEDLLSLDVVVGAQPCERLLSALRHSITARNATATASLWQKIRAFKSPSCPSLGMQHDSISMELLRFLVCLVREPALVVALDEQVLLENFNVLAPVNVSAGRHELVALTAATLVAISNARLAPLDSWLGKGSVILDDWDDLLALLMRSLPLRPMPLWHHDPSGIDANNPLSLLEVAVTCSNANRDAVNTTLDNCRFSHAGLSGALEKALQKGVLCNALVLPVFEAIYRQAIVAPRPAYSSLAMYQLMRAWELVLLSGEELDATCVCTGAEPEIVFVPRGAGASGNSAHPNVHMALLDAMVAAHDRHPINDDRRLCALACHALKNIVATGRHTHIVEKLVQLVLGRNRAKELILAPTLLSQICRYYPAVLPILEPHLVDEGTRKVLPEYSAVVVRSLKQCIDERKRQSVRALVSLLNEVQEPKRCVLTAYVTYMFFTPEEDVVHVYQSLGAAVWTAHCLEIKKDFVEFLRIGAPWDQEDLNSALRQASQTRSGIAVGVLVSPPYNVPLPEDDLFVEHILQHILAPGAPMVVEARERFAGAAL
jgi:hypothetical protein